METLEDRIRRIEYYQELLCNMIQHNNYPVYDLIIRNKLSKEEVEELYELCKDLTDKYESQKEEGLLQFDSLLTQFVGALNLKLRPEETINAMYLQNMFRPLMGIFIRLLKKK